MPKTSETIDSKINRYANKSNGVLTVQTDPKTGKSILFCQCCYTNVNCGQKSQLDQHLNTTSHKQKLKTFQTKQISVDKCLQNTQQEFNLELCQLLVSLNIPFNRLSHPMFKQFCEKYIKYSIPFQTTLYNQCLDSVFNKTFERIQNELKDEYLWLQIDETSDRQNRKVVHIIVGSMSADKNECKSYLLDMFWVERANYVTIAQSFNTALSHLWPEGIKYNKILAVITDT